MNKKFVALMLAVWASATWTGPSIAALAKVRKIGFLTSTLGPPAASYEIFRKALRELGYVEDQNILFEYRAAEDRSRLTELATELAQLKPDVIVTTGGAAARAKMATETVPIVFSYSGDPVEAVFVKSIARPGGNMTGITWLAFELVGKRLELLKEAVPTVSRVGILANPTHPGERRELEETQTTAQKLGITFQYNQVKAARDFDVAFEAIVKENANALLTFPEATTLQHSTQIAEFAAKRRLPSMFAWKENTEAGGLISYGPDREETVRRMAVYVDKILKGAKPADLPIELPRKFDLVINLKTAKQIGVTIPQWMLVKADKVIR
jgi:putative tryptophan/tyrosine transport system substrate-binding protein